MKKIIMLVVTIIMVMMLGIASAENYEEDIYDLTLSYCKENDLFTEYNGIIKDQTYSCIGVFNADLLAEEGIDINRIDNFGHWFKYDYANELEKRYPQYGNVKVEVNKETEYKGVVIYHITVIGENDMLEWHDGIQNTVRIIFGIVR